MLTLFGHLVSRRWQGLGGSRPTLGQRAKRLTKPWTVPISLGITPHGIEAA